MGVEAEMLEPEASRERETSIWRGEARGEEGGRGDTRLGGDSARCGALSLMCVITAWLFAFSR